MFCSRKKNCGGAKNQKENRCNYRNNDFNRSFPE